MAVYLVTGKLGSGKSLATVSKIAEYLGQGRMVATNLDLYLERLINPWAKKTRSFRLPDKPVLDDLAALPAPYEGEYDENKTGLVVLDECGSWFNARNYRDKDRLPVIDYLLHIRKRGWDVMFIVQDAKMIDSQVREGLGEHVVYCSRFDRLRIPGLSWFTKNCLGFELKPPKVHMGLVKYGTSFNSPIAEKWVYRGNDLYNGYDTRQIFGANDCGLHCLLPPYYVYGSQVTRLQHEKRNIAITCAKLVNKISRCSKLFFLTGLLIGWVALASGNESDTKQVEKTEEEVTQANENEEQEVEEKYNPLSGLYISGSVRIDNTYEYIIYNKYGQSVSPIGMGLKITPISACRAYVVSMNHSFQIDCFPTEEKEPETRDAESYVSELKAEAARTASRDG